MTRESLTQDIMSTGIKIKRPVIQDIAAIGLSEQGSPVGEAYKRVDEIPSDPVLDRLTKSITELMAVADKSYQAQERDADYVTRLCTNEFFFYTREPLSLAEFTDLQNRIAQEAKLHSQGVQLILGTFVVKTEDNKVMNVAVHITCGQQPDFHFIVKNYTSPIDVRYKKTDGTGALDVLDKESYQPDMPMPKISVDGVGDRMFTFDNLVPCKTPGGTPFLTAVEVCMDHHKKVAKTNIAVRAQNNPGELDQPISQVLISNFTFLHYASCLTPEVMQVDPRGSKQCKRDVPQHVVQQVVQSSDPQRFGNDYVLIDVDPRPVISLQEADTLALAGKASFTAAIGSLGIGVSSQSPFQIKFPDMSSYLCFKKYLEAEITQYYDLKDIKNVQYAIDFTTMIERSDFNSLTIDLSDAIFFRQQLLDQMVSNLSDTLMTKAKEEVEVVLQPIRKLKQDIPGIQNFTHNPNLEDMTQPVAITELQFIFHTEKEAEMFMEAVNQADPDVEICTKSGDASVDFNFPSFLEDTAFYNKLVQNYQTRAEENRQQGVIQLPNTFKSRYQQEINSNSEDADPDNKEVNDLGLK